MIKKSIIFFLISINFSCLGYSEDIIVYEYDQENGCRKDKPIKIGETNSDGDVTTIGYCYVSNDKKYITTANKEGWPKNLKNSFNPCSDKESSDNNKSCEDIIQSAQSLSYDDNGDNINVEGLEVGETAFAFVDSTGSTNGVFCEEADGNCVEDNSNQSYFIKSQDYYNYIDDLNTENKSDDEKNYLKNQDLLTHQVYVKIPSWISTYGEKTKILVAFSFIDNGLKVEELSNIEKENQTAIDSWIQERKESLLSFQNQVSTVVLNNNAQVSHKFWIFNGMIVEVELGRLPNLIESLMPYLIQDFSVDDSFEGASVTPTLYHDHTQIIESTNVISYRNNNIKGGRVYQINGTGNYIEPHRIAIVEPGEYEIQEGVESANKISCNHYGFSQPGSYNTSHRIKDIKKCSCSLGVICSCSQESCETGAHDTHGTSVASVAAGNVENGQDPNINGSDRRKRSGMAPFADILYYRVPSRCGYSLAIEQAVGKGSSAINMSLTMSPAIGDLSCDMKYNTCGLNETMYGALKAASPIIAAAGNKGKSSNCNVGYPASRPETLSVSGIDTSSTSTTYEVANLSNDSSRGVSSGPYGYKRVGYDYIYNVDISAPFNWRYIYGQNNSYISSQGTSLSAPAIAGITLMTYGWLKKYNWDIGGLGMLAHTLVYGDGHDGKKPVNKIRQSYNGNMSALTGVGKVKVHFPYEPGIKHWKNRMTKIYQGQVIEWAVKPGSNNSLDSSYAGLKAALIHIDRDLKDVAKLELRFVNKCPTSGKPEFIAKSQSNSLLRKYLHSYIYSNGLNYNPLELRCVWVQIKGVKVPRGGVDFGASSYAYTRHANYQILH